MSELLLIFSNSIHGSVTEKPVLACVVHLKNETNCKTEATLQMFVSLVFLKDSFSLMGYMNMYR